MPCFLNQGVTALQLSTDDSALQRRVMDAILGRLRGVSLDVSPAKVSQLVYSTVREMTGVGDPFAKAKRETNRRALAMVPGLRRRIAASSDPLHTAMKVALIGNVIDLGVAHKFDLKGDVENFLMGKNNLTVDDTPRFRELLEDCRRILYVCDNSGEIAFDCLLVEQLKERCEVVASVKSGPIINDATMQDAEEVGLTSLVRVIETGADHIGVDWDNASDEFRDAFRSADIILAKGQGNLETLDEMPDEIFFLLKAKCAEVAAALNVSEGATIFLRNRTSKAQ